MRHIALRTAFPPSLVGRYSHDYYESSATPRRQQRTVHLLRTPKRFGGHRRDASHVHSYAGRQGRRSAVPRGHRRGPPQHGPRPRPPEQQTVGRDGPDGKAGPSAPTAHSHQLRGCRPVSGLLTLVRLPHLSALVPHPARWRRTVARLSGARSRPPPYLQHQAAPHLPRPLRRPEARPLTPPGHMAPRGAVPVSDKGSYEARQARNARRDTNARPESISPDACLGDPSRADARLRASFPRGWPTARVDRVGENFECAVDAFFVVVEVAAGPYTVRTDRGLHPGACQPPGARRQRRRAKRSLNRPARARRQFGAGWPAPDCARGCVRARRLRTVPAWRRRHASSAKRGRRRSGGRRLRVEGGFRSRCPTDARRRPSRRLAGRSDRAARARSSRTRSRAS